jgi:chromosome segregation ATPase
MDNTEQKPLTLTFEDYIKLIGAGPYNEPAFTIFRTLEAHQYKIVYASQQTEQLQAEIEDCKFVVREQLKNVNILKADRETLAQENTSLICGLDDLKSEKEALQAQVERVKDLLSNQMSNYVAVKDILQALNGK